MGSLNFDSDIPLDYGSEDNDEGSFGASASEVAAASDGAPSQPAEPAGEPSAHDGAAASSRSARSRPRGSRGSGASRASGRNRQQGEKKWRSGAIPPAPVFEGDIEADAYCL